MIEFSERFRFSDWPNPKVPSVAAGVYAIWHENFLFYCGMSGRGIDNADLKGKRKFGLITRLNSHASGRLSGDQFCVYVANRLVIPRLDTSDFPKFESGQVKLDNLTKRFIHEHLEYQFVVVDNSAEAYRVEAEARSGKVFGQKPLLNPL